jgi:hypothetical protein
MARLILTAFVSPCLRGHMALAACRATDAGQLLAAGLAFAFTAHAWFRKLRARLPDVL